MRWCALLLTACAGVHGPPTRTRLPDCAASSEAVVCAGHPFAELVCLNRVRREREPDRALSPPIASGPRSCRALGIHYFDDDTVVWLYRAPGFDPERPDLPYLESKLDTRFATRVALSPDGTRLRYRTGSRNLLSAEVKYDSHEYDVFEGKVRHD